MNDERSPRVLVVDDEARVRSLLCDMLAAWGCQAVEAASGETALALLEQGEYDLMLTDFLMPGRSGIDLIRSEEHTSELQSHSDLVCRLLLEKKKRKENRIHHLLHDRTHDTTWAES